MNYTSSLYKSIFAGIHRFEVKVNIAATAEGLVQSSTDYGMDVLTSLSSSRSVFGSGSPRLGLAPAGELSLSRYPYIPASERSFTRRIQNVQSELTLQAQQIAAKVSRTVGDPSSFGWYLDVDKFELRSNGSIVMKTLIPLCTLHFPLCSRSSPIRNTPVP